MEELGFVVSRMLIRTEVRIGSSRSMCIRSIRFISLACTSAKTADISQPFQASQTLEFTLPDSYPAWIAFGVASHGLGGWLCGSEV